MNGNHFLLDTNIIIGLFANDYGVVENIKSHTRIILLPSIVLGELFYGAELSGKKESNKKRIEELARITPIVSCDIDTARIYGVVKSQLKFKGTPIPENDIWIAALSLQHELTLVTRDNHFEHIDMKLERW